MHTYVCLLRAVNVGGTGKLPMAELRSICENVGFANVRTYIASGNVVLRSALTATQVQSMLRAAVSEYADRPVDLLVRTAREMAAILAANPFPDSAPDRTVVIFLDKAPPSDALEAISGLQSEELALGTREIYVHYGAGMADSKLKISATKTGTARNINTVNKLVEMTRR